MSSTSENENKASGTEQEELEKDSVFDFLYHDVRRVGSFLAQFDDAGYLQSLTRSESVTKGSKRGWKFSLGGGLPGDLGSAETSVERGPGEAGSETSERAYDPLWTNARTLLDYLGERDMIRRDIWGARIGQFVLAKGNLLVLDLAMLKSARERPNIQRAVMAGSSQPVQPNRAGRRRQQAQGQARGMPSEAEMVIEMLSIFPHSVQAHLIGENFRAWCSLGEDSLVGLSSDLVLKHGSFVPGEWAVLGILDAFPRSDRDQDAGLSLVA